MPSRVVYIAWQPGCRRRFSLGVQRLDEGERWVPLDREGDAGVDAVQGVSGEDGPLQARLEEQLRRH